METMDMHKYNMQYIHVTGVFWMQEFLSGFHGDMTSFQRTAVKAGYSERIKKHVLTPLR